MNGRASKSSCSGCGAEDAGPVGGPTSLRFCDDCLGVDRQWFVQATENIERWGNQEPTVLLLALVEEIGEVADDLLATADADPHGTGVFQSHAFHLLSEVRHVGFSSREFLEEHFEDENGSPLPEEEMPSLVAELDGDRVIEEVDDAAPLVYQLAWALREADR